MKTQFEIQEMVTQLHEHETKLVDTLDKYAKLPTTLITDDEREMRKREVNAINKTLTHVRVQLHSFRWVLAG